MHENMHLRFQYCMQISRTPLCKNIHFCVVSLLCWVTGMYTKILPSRWIYRWSNKINSRLKRRRKTSDITITLPLIIRHLYKLTFLPFIYVYNLINRAVNQNTRITFTYYFNWFKYAHKLMIIITLLVNIFL